MSGHGRGEEAGQGERGWGTGSRESVHEVSVLPRPLHCKPQSHSGGTGDQPPRPGGATEGSDPGGGRTSSVQGRPLALALLDEGRGAVRCKHLHTLSGASLSGQEERSPALVVPHIQVHQRFGQCLQGFTVTVVGLGACRQPVGTAQDTASFLGPTGRLGSSPPHRLLGPLRLLACTVPRPSPDHCLLPHPHGKAEARTESQVHAPTCGADKDKEGDEKSRGLTAKCKGLTGMVLSTSSRQLKDISKSCKGQDSRC